MDLILWRHAEAEDGIRDLERKLTGKGVRQAQQTAAWLRSRLPEHFRVIASDARRSQQTAEALTSEFEIKPEINPGCAAAAVLKACQWGETEQTVVVVGHQPTLGQLAAWLMAETELDWSVKKSAVWWLSSRSRGNRPQIVLKAVYAPDET